MDNYQAKQLEATKRIEESFKRGQVVSSIVEPVSDYINDNRICLTSVIFIPAELEELIMDKVIDPLREINPIQYFYIPGSFHITANNIRTIADPPLFNDQDIEKVKEVFKKVVPRYNSFTFELKRLFELPTSLAISAFSDKTLGNLALDLRDKLKNAGVADNKTYDNNDIVIASTTISRFTNTPNPGFKQKVKELKEIKIGTFEVNKISLITTNAICYPSKTKIIEEYLLNPSNT